MKKKPDVIYYHDELNDEFAGDDIKPKYIGKDYVYIRDRFPDRLLHLLFYHIIAIPMAYCGMKLSLGHKIVNRKALKKAGKNGYFIYGNHTHNIADAVIPTLVNLPSDVYVIVHPNNVSIPVLGKVTPYLGALPLPDDIHAMRNFRNAIGRIIGDGKGIMIYPEAHIWPYYTDIRPFGDASFSYPVKYNVPVFSLTNTYVKRKIGKRPKLVTYIDGPFFPESGKSAMEQRKLLHCTVYEKMKERAKSSNITVIRYEKTDTVPEKESKDTGE